MATGERELSAKRLSEALSALQAFEMNAEVLDCLEDFVELLQLVGEVENAVQDMCRRHGDSRSAMPSCDRRTVRLKCEARLKAARAALGRPRIRRSVVDGRTWTLEEAIEHALSLMTSSAVAA